MLVSYKRRENIPNVQTSANKPHTSRRFAFPDEHDDRFTYTYTTTIDMCLKKNINNNDKKPMIRLM